MLARTAVALSVLALAACTEHGSGGPITGIDGGSNSRRCGGFGGGACFPNEFCDFPTNTCGATDEQGTCVTRPAGCPDIVGVPTCGCDGMVRSGTCDTNAAGTDVNANGTCKVAAGTFACGFLQCNVTSQYCEHQSGTFPDQFACKTLPGCPSQFPTCSCLAAEPCSSQCTGSGATGLTLTCQPPMGATGGI